MPTDDRHLAAQRLASAERTVREAQARLRHDGSDEARAAYRRAVAEAEAAERAGQRALEVAGPEA